MLVYQRVVDMDVHPKKNVILSADPSPLHVANADAHVT